MKDFLYATKKLVSRIRKQCFIAREEEVLILKLLNKTPLDKQPLNSKNTIVKQCKIFCSIYKYKLILSMEAGLINDRNLKCLSNIQLFLETKILKCISIYLLIRLSTYFVFGVC